MKTSLIKKPNLKSWVRKGFVLWVIKFVSIIIILSLIEPKAQAEVDGTCNRDDGRGEDRSGASQVYRDQVASAMCSCRRRRRRRVLLPLADI